MPSGSPAKRAGGESNPNPRWKWRAAGRGVNELGFARARPLRGFVRAKRTVSRSISVDGHDRWPSAEWANGPKVGRVLRSVLGWTVGWGSSAAVFPYPFLFSFRSGPWAGSEMSWAGPHDLQRVLLFVFTFPKALLFVFLIWTNFN